MKLPYEKIIDLQKRIEAEVKKLNELNNLLDNAITNLGAGYCDATYQNIKKYVNNAKEDMKKNADRFKDFQENLSLLAKIVKKEWEKKAN